MIKNIKIKINLVNLIDHLSGSYSLFEKKGAVYFNNYISRNNKIRKKINYNDTFITINYSILIDNNDIFLEKNSININENQKDIINSILKNELILYKNLKNLLTIEQKITNIKTNLLSFYDLFRTFHIKDNIYSIFYFEVDNTVVSLEKINKYFKKQH